MNKATLTRQWKRKEAMNLSQRPHLRNASIGRTLCDLSHDAAPTFSGTRLSMPPKPLSKDMT